MQKGGVASMVIHMKVKSVFLLTKPGDRAIVGAARGLAEWLLREGYIVYVLRFWKT